MGSISRHIMPLVINSLGGRHTHTHTHTHIHIHKHTHILMIRTGSILRNQVRTGLWPARTWFKNTFGIKKVQASKVESYLEVNA